MKPNRSIQALSNQDLIKSYTKEMIAYGGNMYGNVNEQNIPRFSKNKIKMLRTELFIRLGAAN